MGRGRRGHRLDAEVDLPVYPIGVVAEHFGVNGDFLIEGCRFRDRKVVAAQQAIFADIADELGAGLIGGAGLAPGAHFGGPDGHELAVFEAYANYWGCKVTPQIKCPNINQVVEEHFNTSPSLAASLLDGSVDMAWRGLSLPDLAQVQTNPKFNVFKLPPGSGRIRSRPLMARPDRLSSRCRRAGRSSRVQC